MYRYIILYPVAEYYGHSASGCRPCRLLYSGGWGGCLLNVECGTRRSALRNSSGLGAGYWKGRLSTDDAERTSQREFYWLRCKKVCRKNQTETATATEHLKEISETDVAAEAPGPTATSYNRSALWPSVAQLPLSNSAMAKLRQRHGPARANAAVSPAQQLPPP
jgi:hypothetical protein